MTFSDAEEDQPSAIQTGDATPNSVSAGSSRPDSNAAASDNQEDGTEDIKPEESTSSTLSKETASPSCIATSASSGSVSPSPTAAAVTGMVGNTVGGSAGQSTFIAHNQQNDIAEHPASQAAKPEAASSSNTSSPQSAALPLNAEVAVGVEGSVRGLETEKVMEKLQQIDGYIQQTSAAMQALENEGDLTKIGQYNTLVKCMRELKKSEGKLTSHLNKLKAKSSQSELALQGSLMEQFEALFNSLQYQESECVETLSKSLLTDMSTPQPSSRNASETHPSGRASGTSSGSASIGVVGNLNGDGRHLSMQDRLARHESEQIQLSERLRESLVRRQELMARYQATRERLNNLKRQRQGLVHEERRLLQSVGAPENPYDDPISGSDTWTIEQLESAIRDFEGLRAKVDNLHQVYSTKMQAIDENDSEARIDLQRKIDEIVNKKRQIVNALAQMNELLQAKRERAAEENLVSLGSEPSVEPAPIEGEDSVPLENDNPPLLENPVENVQAPEDENIEAEGAVAMSAEDSDILAKQQHLQSLKNQLAAMKRLLHVSHTSMPTSATADQGDPCESEPTALLGEHVEAGEDDQDNSHGEYLADSTIIGVNGEVIHLTESERRNPQVVSKFQELSQAKKRLAKMEEVMQKIAEARQTGRSLTEVLSPENMAILTEAREEEERHNLRGTRSSNVNESRDVSQCAEINVETSRRSSNTTPRQMHSVPRDSSIPCNTPPRKNQVNRNQEKSSNGRPQWEREREISAMQFHLKKKTPKIPPINEGFKVGREKGALKKQTRDLLNESGGDPRLMEVITLQEELREKKNALEALMRRMGKSSSFTLDNISDNISENVSDDANSDTTDKLLSASWGSRPTRGGHRSFQDHNEEEEGEEEEEREDLADVNYVFARGSVGSTHASPDSSPRRQHSLPRPQIQPKNRNRLTPPKLQQQRNSEATSLLSVNNLSSGSLPKSVRPKHNRNSGRNVPSTSWENTTNGNACSSQTPPSNSKVQNTVAAALSQLAQVQDTINTLYGELRTAELTVRQQEAPILNPYGSNTIVVPQPPFTTPAVTQNLLPSYAMSPLPNTQGRGDLGASSHILAGLQQCFSQLYLHSLEIQSLSKHLQIIDQREKSLSPPHQREEQRGGSVERRGERAPAPARRDNETSQQNFRIRVNSNFHVPHIDNQKDDSYLDREEYLLNPQTNEGFPRNGVSNPLYVRLCNAQQPPSWQMDTSEEIDLELAKNFSPFDGSASDGGQPPSNGGGDPLLDSSSHFPLEAEEMNDELPWTTVSSPQIHQSSSDILNNQVLPGTRANNYWDNFRSYSRQNPLSTTAKSNTGEQLSLSGSSTPGRTQSLNTASTQLQQSVGFENKNRHFNVTAYPNNSINKASDKNSSSSRNQNRGGARSRYPSHQTNGRKPALANPLNQRNAASPSGQHLGTDSCKRNNRPDFRVPFEADVSTQQDSTQNLGCVTDEEFLFNANASPLRFNNSRRFAKERGGPLPRSAEENDVEFCAGRNTNLRRSNATSHDEGHGASETFSRVVREAESLMQKHSQQPHFLLQLFHHASKITSNTDQQVALELLRELSYQRQQNNIQHNRWTSNSSVTHNENFSFPTPIRDANYRNITGFSNKASRTPRGISGSDASESGITSDEDDTKVLNQMMKNLTPTSSGVSVYPPLRPSPHVFLDPSNSPCSPVHVSNAVAQNQHSHKESYKEFPKDMNIVASKKEREKLENQHRGNRLSRKRQEVETPQLRNYITSSTSCDSPSAPSNSLTSPSTKSNSKLVTPLEQHSPIGDKANNNRRQTRKSPKRNLATSAEDKFKFSPKIAKNVDPKVSPIPTSGLIQEPVSGFEAIVSSSLREVLLCFESVDYSLTSTSQILDNLLHSIMRQVQFHSSTLGFSSNFVASIDAQLKVTLRGFYGKTLPAIRQELAAAVTQVLIQEYCSLFMQQDNPSEARQSQMQESNCANEFRAANRSDSEANRKTFHPQYNKQMSSHSLFSSLQESTATSRQGKSANTSWSLNPSIPAGGVPTNREHALSSNVMAYSREEELKNEAVGAKAKGAISKNCADGFSHPEGSFGGPPREASSCRLVESPLPEASSFPESWVIQRAGSGSGDGDGLYSFAESSLPRERDERGFLNVLENAKLEHNDAEADQDDHTRNLDLSSLSLPVHDLAEADQSQDPVEADTSDSAIENDRYEASASPTYSQPLQEPKEFSMRFLTKKNVTSSKDIPEQGLDEVPTRLPSAAEGPSLPNINGRPSGGAEGNEDKISTNRYGPFVSSQSQATAVPQNEPIAAHHADTSSGKGG